MPTIGLNRQFFEWHEGALSDPDLISRWQSDDLLSWETISARRRVVILAEAGSGKTVEMREQARRLTEAGAASRSRNGGRAPVTFRTSP
jgi:hypothetical protein